MSIIQVNDLLKVFKVEEKQNTLWARLKAIFSPTYKQIEAVKHISFDVQPGEKIAFLGPNGAWKSTTIKMLTWILHPTSGEITVCGCVPSRDRKELVYQIGAVFGQTSRLRYHLTPEDTFELMSHMYDIPHEKYVERKQYLTTKFGIEDLLQRPIRKLSLGQRMKCELVASLLHTPKVLFLDEPTIGLDIIAKSTLREVINQINHEEGTTIFLTSHDIGDIEEVCERVIIVNHGVILYDGGIDELRKQHVAARYIILTLSSGQKLQTLPLMEVTSQQENIYHLRIPNDAVQEVLSHLTTTHQIEDISIQQPSIEEIIKTFY